MPTHNTSARPGPVRIGVVAPGRAIERSVADRVTALIKERYGAAAELVVHPQCFAQSGHFAGSDAMRTDAFVETANDPDLHAVWFARGGYGSVRLADDLMDRLGPAARTKPYLGYSDVGTLLARLYRHGIGSPVHGPMPVDIIRDGGAAAVIRALDYLVHGDRGGLEPAVSSGPVAAFNLCILSHLMGTAAEPDLTGHAVMVEEVGEHLYRIDRSLAHVTAQPGFQGVAGLLLGRCSAIPDNDPDFGADPETIARFWCDRRGIAYLGPADIGHDADNKIVPFGRPPAIA